MSQLPASLLKYLADSELTLIRWDGSTSMLTFQLIKEIGDEKGTLMFHDVSYVDLLPSFSLESIEVERDQDKSTYRLHESWGALYRVVARELTYEING